MIQGSDYIDGCGSLRWVKREVGMSRGMESEWVTVSGLEVLIMGIMTPYAMLNGSRQLRRRGQDWTMRLKGQGTERPGMFRWPKKSPRSMTGKPGDEIIGEWGSVWEDCR